MREVNSPNLYWYLSSCEIPYTEFRTMKRLELRVNDITNLPVYKNILFEKFNEKDIVNWWHNEYKKIAIALGWDILNHQELLKFYDYSKKWLIENGYFIKEQLENIPKLQTIMRYYLLEYKSIIFNIYNYYNFPYYLAENHILELSNMIKSHKPGGDNLFTSNVFISYNLEDPVLNYYYIAKLDQKIALLKCIEAIRLHKNKNNSYPEKLDDIKVVPVPRDPITGHDFIYKTADNIAHIEYIEPKSNIDGKSFKYLVEIH